MFLVSNERTKLIASLFNGLATSLVAVGVFAPAITFLYGISQLASGFFQMSLVTVVCVSGGAILHIVGRRTLGRLRE